METKEKVTLRLLCPFPLIKYNAMVQLVLPSIGLHESALLKGSCQNQNASITEKHVIRVALFARLNMRCKTYEWSENWIIDHPLQAYK